MGITYVRFEPTPMEVADYLSDYFEDKTVFDLGAGDGEFALAIAQYAKKVVAVEMDERLPRRPGVTWRMENFMDTDLSDADTIFVFLNFLGMSALTRKLERDDWHGTLLSHYYPLHRSLADIKEPDEVIDIPVGSDIIPILRYEL